MKLNLRTLLFSLIVMPQAVLSQQTNAPFRIQIDMTADHSETAKGDRLRISLINTSTRTLTVPHVAADSQAELDYSIVVTDMNGNEQPDTPYASRLRTGAIDSNGIIVPLQPGAHYEEFASLRKLVQLSPHTTYFVQVERSLTQTPGGAILKSNTLRFTTD